MTCVERAPYTPITCGPQQLHGLQYSFVLQSGGSVRKMPSLGPSAPPSAEDMMFNPAYNEENLRSMLEQMQTYQRPPSISAVQLLLHDVQEGSFTPPQTPVVPTPERPASKRPRPRLKNVTRFLKPRPVALPRYLLRRTSSAPEMKGMPTF